MKPGALRVFACPACHGPLDLHRDREDGEEVLEGLLTCRGCGQTYAITRGVPRFVLSGAYAATFGRQWNWFRTVQLDSHNGTRRSAEEFRATTGWTVADLAGQRVLDAGVGEIGRAHV